MSSANGNSLGLSAIREISMQASARSGPIQKEPGWQGKWLRNGASYSGSELEQAEAGP